MLSNSATNFGPKRCLSVSCTNALDHFDDLEKKFADRNLIVLLDYDGTLTPIVNDPSKALLSDQVKEILSQLASYFVTGIVTGRSLKKIRNFVNVPELFYAGSHGFDILSPIIHSKEFMNDNNLKLRCIEDGDDGASKLEDCSEIFRCSTCTPDISVLLEHATIQVSKDVLHVYRNHEEYIGYNLRYQVAGEFLPVLQTIKTQLQNALNEVEGSEVEDNVYSISVHYRNCERSLLDQVYNIVNEIKSSHDGIRLRKGKEVFELQPDIDWNKGRAVEMVLDLLQNQHLVENEDSVEKSDTSELFAIFIGDDTTDEDAFELFSEDDGHTDGKRIGAGILVSEYSRLTTAKYTLKNPDEVVQFLQLLIKFGENFNLKPVQLFQDKTIFKKCSEIL